MAHPNEEIVRKASDAFTARDYDTFLGYHHEDSVVHTPQGETLRGHDAIRKNLEQLDSMFDAPSERTTHDILANDEHAIVLAKDRVTKDGKTVDIDQVVVIHLRDGKAAEVWVHLTDPQAMMELMGG
jgi:ketosteroid isomerase-like protein